MRMLIPTSTLKKHLPLPQLESQELLDALNVAEIGVWHWKIEENTEWWSDAYYRALDYEPGEIEACYDTFTNEFVQPKYVSSVESVVKNHMEKNDPFRIVVPLKRKDGVYRRFLVSGQMHRSESGTPLHMTGSIVDVNEDQRIREESSILGGDWPTFQGGRMGSRFGEYDDQLEQNGL